MPVHLKPNNQRSGPETFTQRWIWQSGELSCKVICTRKLRSGGERDASELSLSQSRARPIQRLATHIPYLSEPRRSRLVHHDASLCAASIGQDGTNTRCVAWVSSKIRRPSFVA